jgi:hypothetical protein
MRPVTRDLLRIDAEVRKARTVALGRAYPLLKQAAEILELEAIEPSATRVKKLRQEVGALLAIESADGTLEFGG